MDHSVYAPPKADLNKRGEADSNGDQAFYVVSMRKFALLFFFTLGLYQVVWCYKNWSAYKDRCRYSGSADGDIWPVPRAIFSVFFFHSLLRKVDEYASEKERPLDWNSDSVATLLVGLVLASNIADRLSSRHIGLPYTGLLAMVLLVPMYFSFRKAQQAINISCADPAGVSNSKLTAANWIWLVVGSLFCMLALLGMLVPDAKS